ncbi:helix-turn-helix domain-containing protein [Dysosmobacter sp.]
MNKEVFGTFITAARKEAGLTQQALADQLHVTDKAVSKWERGLCYPDLTIMENLATALGLTITELMACERIEHTSTAANEDNAVKSVLTISGEAMQKQKKKLLFGILGVLAAIAAVIAIVYLAANVTEVREDLVVSKQVVDDTYYVYVEEDNHLLRLECADRDAYEAVIVDGVTFHDMEFRWNRLTYQGTLKRCVPNEENVSLGGMDAMTGSAIDFGSLLGYECVWQQFDRIYPDPERKDGYLFTFRYYFYGDGSDYSAEGEETTLVVAEDCRKTMADDYDGDGIAELFVLTRYDEEPYMLYDIDGDKITSEFVTAVPDAVLEWFESDMIW